MANFAVIGLGRFGRAVASHLTREGQGVLAVDRDESRLALVATSVEGTATADTTSEEAVAALRLERLTGVVVAIGPRSTEASLLTTAILHELEIPRIVARAFDDRHRRLLLAMGATEVVNPEEESGQRLALHLANPSIVEQVSLGEATIAEVETPESFVGRQIEDLDLRRQFSVTLLAIRRDGRTRANPDITTVIASDDVLLLLGSSDAVRAVAALR